jgi:hypothetical protein
MTINRNTIHKVAFEALTSSSPKAIPFNERDDKSVIIVNNTTSSSVTVTVKAGNGIQGVSDLVLTAESGISVFKIESGRFKNVSGDYKGKIVLTSSGTPGVAIVALD